MSSIRSIFVRVTSVLMLAMTVVTVPFAGAAHAAVLSASINAVSFKAAVATTYDHTTGGGVWNDGSTTYQKGELQASDYQCGEYASFFMELQTPANPFAGNNFTAKVVLAFTRDTTGQSGVALEPETGANHLLVQDGTNDTAPNPATPTATIAGGGNAPAVSYDGGMFVSGKNAFLTFYVDGLNPSQKVIIRSDAKIYCLGNSTPTGNLQASLTSLEITDPAETISAGAQTVNFKTLGNLGMIVLDKKVVAATGDAAADCAAAADAITVAAGTQVRYCYTVTNYRGSAELSVTLTDDMATPAVPGDDTLVTLDGLTAESGGPALDDLAANSTATGNMLSTWPAEGEFTNTAYLKVGGTTKSTSNAVVTVLGLTPSYTITKTSSSIPSKVGDVIAYTITLTNTGGVDLNNTYITDPTASFTSCTNSGNGTPVAQTGHTSTSTTLASGKKWTCTATYTVVAGDVTAKHVDNTATGHTDEAGTQDATKTVNLALFTLSKTSSSVPSKTGDVINYTITMTNTGNITLTNATIADPTASFISCTDSGDGTPVAQSGHTTTATTLSTTETWTCTATYTVTDADVTAKKVDNTATGDSDQAGPKTAAKTVNISMFTLAKTSSSTPSKTGDVITYTITLTNTGLGGLTGVTIADPTATLTTCTNSGDGTPVAQSGHTSTTTAVASGDTWTCTATYTVTDADVTAKQVDNTATGDSTETDSKTATKTVDLALFTITKTSSDVPSKTGDVITYTITMTNTGNIDLTGATIADPNATFTSCTNSGDGTPVAQSGHTSTSTTIASGDTWTCTATHTVTDADVTAKQVDNTATGDSDQSDSKTATKTVDLALFTITKNSSSVPTKAGDVITYTITLTNTGNIGLTGVTIADPKATLTSCTNSGGGGAVAQSGHTSTTTAVAAGDTWTCTATYTVTDADMSAAKVDNTATGDSTETDPKTASKTVTITQNPSYTVVKTNTTATAPKKAGDIVTYSIVVTNTGNVTLVKMTVTDANATLGTCTAANGSNLAPAATMTCSASHAVTQDEVNAGKTENTAVASATGTTPVTSNKVTVTITPDPTLDVTLEQLTDKKLTTGDKVQYEVVVTNSGNVTLNSVSPVVTNFVITSCTPTVPAVLAPGETIKCRGFHIVTGQDVLVGVIKAKAVATGVSALNPAVKVPAKAPDVEVPLELPLAGSNTVLPAELSGAMILVGVAMLAFRRRRRTV